MRNAVRVACAKKKWKYIAGALSVLVLIFVSNVYDPERALQICGVAVDRGVHADYAFSFEVAVPQGKTMRAAVIRVEADSLTRAMERADLMSARPLQLNHGILLVIGDTAVTDIRALSEMYLKQWRGARETFMAVCEGSAADILDGEQSENLRSAGLGEQLAAAQNKLGFVRAEKFADRCIGGEMLSLPMVTKNGAGYSITGTYYCEM